MIYLTFIGNHVWKSDITDSWKILANFNEIGTMRFYFPKVCELVIYLSSTSQVYTYGFLENSFRSYRKLMKYCGGSQYLN